ncbi:hypothetical protein DL770_008095 [Monosporascus sp. CRB-9-2]|nr:hypothetical protein DL770_008095 [Monosporascus sp. CRB-9-2]
MGWCHGLPHVSNARKAHTASAEACHPASIDCFELKKLSQLPFTRLLGGGSETLWLVTHHLLPAPVLMKIAEVPPVGLVENETVVYAALERKGIAPWFLAHVASSGRIIDSSSSMSRAERQKIAIPRLREGPGEAPRRGLDA